MKHNSNLEFIVRGLLGVGLSALSIFLLVDFLSSVLIKGYKQLLGWSSGTPSGWLEVPITGLFLIYAVGILYTLYCDYKERGKILV